MHQTQPLTSGNTQRGCSPSPSPAAAACPLLSLSIKAARRLVERKRRRERQERKKGQKWQRRQPLPQPQINDYQRIRESQMLVKPPQQPGLYPSPPAAAALGEAFRATDRQLGRFHRLRAETPPELLPPVTMGDQTSRSKPHRKPSASAAATQKTRPEFPPWFRRRYSDLILLLSSVNERLDKLG